MATTPNWSMIHHTFAFTHVAIASQIVAVFAVDGRGLILIAFSVSWCRTSCHIAIDLLSFVAHLCIA